MARKIKNAREIVLNAFMEGYNTLRDINESCSINRSLISETIKQLVKEGVLVNKSRGVYALASKENADNIAGESEPVKPIEIKVKFRTPQNAQKLKANFSAFGYNVESVGLQFMLLSTTKQLAACQIIEDMDSILRNVSNTHNVELIAGEQVKVVKSESETSEVHLSNLKPCQIHLGESFNYKAKQYQVCRITEKESFVVLTGKNKLLNTIQKFITFLAVELESDKAIRFTVDERKSNGKIQVDETKLTSKQINNKNYDTYKTGRG